MVTLNLIALFSNGLTLSLALGFLIIVLWYDYRRQLNQVFAVFLFFVMLWSSGALLLQVSVLIDPRLSLGDLASGVMEFGFTGASISIYSLATILVGIHSRRLSMLAFASLALILAYQFLLVVIRSVASATASSEVVPYRFLSLFIFFYLIFDTITLYLVWRYRRKIRSSGLLLGIGLFVLGQTFVFLNPRLQAVAASTAISSVGTLLLSFSLVRAEIITPLTNRISQVEAMQKVSLAITSQLAIETALTEIAVQAVGLLEAQGAGIFLRQGETLELASAYNLPKQLLHQTIPLGAGVAGAVAIRRQTIHLEHYGRDWAGRPDLPLARETFGSVICVPLIFGSNVIGVLMVIAGVHGRLFDADDVHLLELLGGQAAVAIAHSRLFEEQRELTVAVESARSQLETVLVSTENPVVAVDREFRLIFANPVARRLFSIPDNVGERMITEILPVEALPALNRGVLRDLRRKRVHIYEVSLDTRVFLCHLARLGGARVAGWVAVLNDVTQLKELDRLKSEMVRWASHDLKNPLTGAMLYLDLLSESLDASDHDDARQAVSVIEKQLDRMNRIIRGILDIERLNANAGIVSVELCLPQRIVSSAVEEVEHLADDKRVSLHADVASDVGGFLGDPGQFERALINLIENAIKFTPAGGEVNVTVESRDGEVVFAVKDNGVGIPEHLQSRIFERFFRGGQWGQHGTEHVSGSGLGLSLVKAIVESHKGRVWVESEEGMGAAFYLAIPGISEARDVSYSQ